MLFFLPFQNESEMVGQRMSRPDPRRPVQPWIPQRPTQVPPRPVVARKKGPGGGGAGAWVMALAVAQVIGVLMFMAVLYVLTARGTGRSTDMAMAVFGGGVLIGGALLAVVNLAQLVLVILAIVRGSVVGGITAAVAGLVGGAAAWAGLMYGSLLAMVAAQ